MVQASLFFFLPPLSFSLCVSLCPSVSVPPLPTIYLRTSSLSCIEMAKSRKAATLLSFATKDMGRCRPRLARPHARGSPFHLDVQVELFPEVVVQGRDLRLEVLIHHCAVGQCLQGRGLPYVIVHLLSLMGLTITRTEPKGHGELSTPIHLCFLNVGARGQPPQWWTHSLQTVSQTSPSFFTF